ncbi:hypothetical protein DHODJN_25895 [Methylorubrum extorquens]
MRQIGNTEAAAIWTAARTLLIYAKFWGLMLAETFGRRLTSRRLLAGSAPFYLTPREQRGSGDAYALQKGTPGSSERDGLGCSRDK